MSFVPLNISTKTIEIIAFATRATRLAKKTETSEGRRNVSNVSQFFQGFLPRLQDELTQSGFSRNSFDSRGTSKLESVRTTEIRSNFVTLLREVMDQRCFRFRVASIEHTATETW